MRLEHGNHNESLCDMLLENGGYNDWVVTAAFYATVHFVEYKMFPCKIEGRDYTTFDEYYDHEINDNDIKTSKHTLKSRLVNTRIPSVAGQYRWLKEACMNSRYTDYNVSREKAKSCNMIMKIIKEACV